MHKIVVILVIWIVSQEPKQIDTCILFRIFGSKFNIVDSFYKHISWLNELICG